MKLRRWRRAEYDRLIELGWFVDERLELLDGHLVLRDRQTPMHAATVGHIADVLGTAFGAGWHCRTHGPVALDDDSEPEPEITVVPSDPLDYFHAHPATAALVVEVADSSLQVDRRLKALLYARARLPEYWIVNLVDDVIERHRRPEAEPASAYGAVYRDVERLDRAASITPLGAPTARVAVSALLPPET